MGEKRKQLNPCSDEASGGARYSCSLKHPHLLLCCSCLSRDITASYVSQPSGQACLLFDSSRPVCFFSCLFFNPFPIYIPFTSELLAVHLGIPKPWLFNSLWAKCFLFQWDQTRQPRYKYLNFNKLVSQATLQSGRRKFTKQKEQY